MHLNENGFVVQEEWTKSFQIRRELKQDVFVVMPNHFHAIVRIVDPGNSLETHGQNVATNIVETHGVRLNTADKTKTGIAYRTPKSISAMIAGFKSGATKRIQKNMKNPGTAVWQPRFHDHIVRDERELFAIRQYIKNNPSNWDNDRNVIETQDGKQGKQPWFVYLP
jgi:REP element-mobilizing transposase RayT